MIAITASLRPVALAGAIAAALVVAGTTHPALPQAAAPAASPTGIAAIVNDQVITGYDLDQRVKVAIVSAGLKDTPDVRRRVTIDVLNTLIDERLQLQEAKRLNLGITQADIDKGKTTLEARNNAPPGSFSKLLADQGLPESAVIGQMTAELAWNKIISVTMVPKVDLTDDEIDKAYARLTESIGKYRIRLSEIFLPVETPDRDATVRADAAKLVDDLRAGADFAAMARQFSRGSSAYDGGALGLVIEDQLLPEVATVAHTIDLGIISDPVAAGGGYYILRVSERSVIGSVDPNAATVRLKQIALPIAANATDADINAVLARAQSFTASIKTCAAMDATIQEIGNRQSGDLGLLRITDLSERIRAAVLELPIGQASAPVRTDALVQVFVVCERNQATPTLPQRAEVAETLWLQRLDLLARRSLRDLRRTAVIDVRLK